jgi:2,4-dienoyl-CoA reductase-like NADH-dependent reductase (Old Yellow Enzyme family)
VRGGLWLDGSIATARLLEGDGTLDGLQLTGGSSLQNPMYYFRGEPPVAELAAAFPQPLRTAVRATGTRFLRRYPFEEAYFLASARQVREAVALPLTLLGGITTLATAERAIAEGFDLVALGRALLREPGLVARWRDQPRHQSLCVHCNKCMPTVYQGVHCVLVPPAERPGHRAVPAPVRIAEAREARA